MTTKTPLPVDENGVVWLATTDGLIRYDLERYSKIELGPITDSEIRSIISFDGGHYWLSSETYGLVYFDGKDWLFFDEDNGLPSKVMSYRGLYQDYEDHLWAATAEGVVYSSNPDPLPLTSGAPKVKSVTIGEKAILADEENTYHHYLRQALQIEVIALDFPGNDIAYRYRIKNDRDSSWHLLGNENYIPFKGTKRGLTSLELSAKRGQGYQWSPTSLVQLVGHKHWYQSNLFVVILALIFLAGLWWLLRVRKIRPIDQIKNIEKRLFPTTKKIFKKKKDINLDQLRLNTILQVSELSHQQIRGLAVFKKLSNLLNQSFDLDIIELGIHDKKRDSLRIQGFLKQLNRYTLRNEEMSQSSSLVSWSIHHQQTILIDDLEKDWKKYLQEPGFDKAFQSQILVPFTSIKGSHLVLLVGGIEKNHFEDSDLKMFQIIASILKSRDWEWLRERE
ncbi:MAG: hypothetical protein AAF242_19695 [Bacteroidota bacterium]